MSIVTVIFGYIIVLSAVIWGNPELTDSQWYMVGIVLVWTGLNAK